MKQAAIKRILKKGNISASEFFKIFPDKTDLSSLSEDEANLYKKLSKKVYDFDKVIKITQGEKRELLKILLTGSDTQINLHTKSFIDIGRLSDEEKEQLFILSSKVYHNKQL